MLRWLLLATAAVADLSILIVRREGPATHACLEVSARLIEVEILQLHLLVLHDDVDSVLRSEAVLRGDEQRVRIRRQIGAHNRTALADQRVEEAGSLVAEPVVIVSPAGGRQQDVDRRQRLAPRQSALLIARLDDLQPSSANKQPSK